MKITNITVYSVDIPVKKPKKYPNKTYDALDSSVVKIRTDAGVTGWGEVCPIGSMYQPEHALGVRAALQEMCKGLIGEDPTQTGRINAKMNSILMGGEYAKSAIDIACWDIAAKAYGQPLYRLLGGKMIESARCYCEISYGPPETVRDQIEDYRSQGYRHFQIKVGRGGNFETDIGRIRVGGESVKPGEALVVDANKAWKPHEAIRILRATENVDYYIEQPCLTYEECLSIRRTVRQPMILDECLSDVNVLLRALRDDSFEGIGCKITRVGGITGMVLIRDICTAAAKFITCDDAWGSDLSVAATTAVAMSTPPATMFGTYVSTNFSKLHYDPDAARFDKGQIVANEKPGLGVDPDEKILGAPVLEF